MYLVSLSEQQLADYSKHNSGCNDGLMESFREHISQSQFTFLASNFREQFSQSSCPFSRASFASNEPGYMGGFSHRKPHLNLREYGDLERIHWWSDELGPVRRHGLG